MLRQLDKLNALVDIRTEISRVNSAAGECIFNPAVTNLVEDLIIQARHDLGVVDTPRVAGVYRHTNGNEYLISSDRYSAEPAWLINIQTGARCKMTSGGVFSRKNLTRIRDASQHDMRNL